MISQLCFPTLLLFGALFSFSTVQATVDKSSVGALTPLSSKSTICNVLDYGGVADNLTDIGPAISAAFTKCTINGGATLYFPPGSYSLQTGVTLNKGSAFAIQIDGLITLSSTCSFGGNAIVIENANDIEVFSSNGLEAINGQGYIYRPTTPSQKRTTNEIHQLLPTSQSTISFSSTPQPSTWSLTQFRISRRTRSPLGVRISVHYFNYIPFHIRHFYFYFHSPRRNSSKPLRPMWWCGLEWCHVLFRGNLCGNE